MEEVPAEENHVCVHLHGLLQDLVKRLERIILTDGIALVHSLKQHRGAGHNFRKVRRQAAAQEDNTKTQREATVCAISVAGDGGIRMAEL